MIRSLASALLVTMVACSPSPAQDAALVVSDDPRLVEIASDLLPELSDRAGLPLRRPVRVEWRSRSQLVDYLRYRLDQELPAPEAAAIRDAYALLGLVPPDLDLRGLLLSVYTEQVAGFYDPDSTALFVLEDQPDQGLETVLIHELVHAVQDQAASLDSLTAKERGGDRRTAAQAAIEGHASLVMFELMAERLQGTPVDLAQLPDFARTLRPALAAMMSQSPALGRAPRIVQEALVFPYVDGAGYVQSLWRDRGARAAPFGDALPQSTEQVLAPERRLGDPPDEPTEIAFGFGPDVTVLHEDALGELGLRVFLEERAEASASGRAAGWDGDRYALVETTDGRGLVWVTVWDGQAERDAFLGVAEAAVAALPGGGTVVGTEVEGRPATVMRVGSVPAGPEIRLTGGTP